MTVRVIDMGRGMERTSTNLSISRLGDLDESRSPSPSRSKSHSSGLNDEDANLLLRLIDLHSKQNFLTSERAEDLKTEDEMDDDELLVMRLSQFSAASVHSTRAKTQSKGKAPRRSLRRQHSDIAPTTRHSIRRASRRRATDPAERTFSDPMLRLRPLLDPKTKQA